MYNSCLLVPYQGDHCRTIGVKAAAKENNVELIYKVQPRTPEHLVVSNLGKVPAFVGEDGFKLYECIAIAIYSKFEMSISRRKHQKTKLTPA